MKNLSLIAMLTAIFIAGCSTKPVYNYSPEFQKINYPPSGEVRTISLGENMLSQGYYMEADAIYFERDYDSYPYAIKQGYFVKQGEDKDFVFYRSTQNSDSGQVIKTSWIVDPPLGILLTEKESGRLCVMSIYNMIGCYGDKEESSGFTPIGGGPQQGTSRKEETSPTTVPEFKKKRYSLRNDDGSFQQTLIYNGRDGDKINIGYREFSGNMARGAFSNEVEYDLTISNQIAYKSALLEVIDADNVSITYKVIRNFKEEK